MAHLPLTILARQAFIQDELKASADTKRLIAEQCNDVIIKATDVLIRTLNQQGKILLCGNGGSAADAQHLATELVIRMNPALKRPAIPAIALSTDSFHAHRRSQRYRLRQRVRTRGGSPRTQGRCPHRHQHQRQFRERQPGPGTGTRRWAWRPSDCSGRMAGSRGNSWMSPSSSPPTTRSASRKATSRSGTSSVR